MVYECVEIEDLKQKILLSKMLTIRFGQNSETNIFPSLFESQLYHVPLLERRQTRPLMSLSPGNLNVNKSQLNSLLESLKSITRVEINFILIISLGSLMGGLIGLKFFFIVYIVVEAFWDIWIELNLKVACCSRLWLLSGNLARDYN